MTQAIKKQTEENPLRLDEMQNFVYAIEGILSILQKAKVDDFESGKRVTLYLLNEKKVLKLF